MTKLVLANVWKDGFNICKPLSIIQHIKKSKQKSHDFLRTCIKAFGKVQHPYMIKAIKKQGTEETYLMTVKASHGKLIANILLSEEKNKSRSPKIKNKTRVPMSPMRSQISAWFLKPYRDDGIQTGREEANCPTLTRP